jgi:surface antigen
MVLSRSQRLPSGHVAVVSRVLSRRQIMVTQANWVHHRVTQDQPVTDMSDHGDWSVVRVW